MLKFTYASYPHYSILCLKLFFSHFLRFLLVVLYSLSDLIRLANASKFILRKSFRIHLFFLFQCLLWYSSKYSLGFALTIDSTSCNSSCFFNLGLWTYPEFIRQIQPLKQFWISQNFKKLLSPLRFSNQTVKILHKKQKIYIIFSKGIFHMLVGKGKSIYNIIGKTD